MTIRRVRTLTPLNYQIRIPGHAGAFSAPDLRFNPDGNLLLVKTDFGVVTLGEDDDLRVDVLDLDIPAIMRQQSAREGWVETSLQELIQRLRITFLMEE